MDELDSLIVACSKKNFNEQFIGEMAWYPISINSSKIDSIKYVFAYQKSPIAAITHLAEVGRIEKIESLKKYKIIFKAPPTKINPVLMGEDQRNVPQNPRYANHDRVLKAKKMDQIF